MPGLKYSRQRESIINCLKGRNYPPDSRYDLRVGAGRVSEDQSWDGLQKPFFISGSGRNSPLFMRGKRQDHYDADTSQHYHFVCKKCRAVSDLHMPPLEHIDVLAKDGFDGEIDGHFVLFYGICGKCKENEKNS